jgi:alpha-amylase/alpha-mannosidase (GH57 family)
MAVPKKFVCIHGHFYQPPRENAWLEHVEAQDSAAPFHDWNERINFECYAPNAAARRINEAQNIISILNNYKYLSFNFGPTLLSWLEKADYETYQSILKADQESITLHGGHGSAIAQVYNHLIMPLANKRDKETQVIWGIKDFEYRFKRKPEGMWLAETAVDLETLEVLASNGIHFTILAPSQAKSWRKIGEKNWNQIGFDTRRPYLCQLPSGQKIALFFYDGAIAQGVAFEGLLNDGQSFAQRLINGFDSDDSVQIVHIATDGESYGHHHRNGEMALAACFQQLIDHPEVVLTNYGEFLSLFPPEYEVEIHENSSWSCAHGVERWKSNCGCKTGGSPWWNQSWRGPLRVLLNQLRDEIIPIYQAEASLYLKDIWQARNEYIEVILDRKPEVVRQFLWKHALRPVEGAGRIKTLRLLEMQRNAMLMFTSCGWFFDEVSGLETNQILQYANRAINYAAQTADVDFHQQFIEALENTPSNVFKNAGESYRQFVLPSKVDLLSVGMHFAAASIFEEYPEKLDLFNYEAESEFFEKKIAGNQIVTVGRARMRSKITFSEKTFSFSVLYLGQQNLIGNISVNMTPEIYQKMAREVLAAFEGNHLGEVIGLMQLYFGSKKYSFKNLFQDEKRKILEKISKLNFKKALQSFRDIYNDNYQLMSSMLEGGIPVPPAYKAVVSFVINQDLRALFKNGPIQTRSLKMLLEEMQKWYVAIEDEQGLKLAISERIFSELCQLDFNKSNPQDFDEINEILALIKESGLKADLWKSQNIFFQKLELISKKNKNTGVIKKLGELLNIEI